MTFYLNLIYYIYRNCYLFTGMYKKIELSSLEGMSNLLTSLSYRVNFPQ